MHTPDLDHRLAEAIPGATVKEERANPQERRFVVYGRPPSSPKRADSALAHGSTKREAIDRAVHLFGRPAR